MRMTSVAWEQAGLRWSVQCGDNAVTVTRADQELRMTRQECVMLTRQLKAFAKGAPTGPARAGLPWTDEENERLADQWEAGATVEVLAKELERSAGAVRARIVGTQIVATLDELDEVNERRGGKASSWSGYNARGRLS